MLLEAVMLTVKSIYLCTLQFVDTADRQDTFLDWRLVLAHHWLYSLNIIMKIWVMTNLLIIIQYYVYCIRIYMYIPTIFLHVWIVARWSSHWFTGIISTMVRVTLSLHSPMHCSGTGVPPFTQLRPFSQHFSSNL